MQQAQTYGGTDNQLDFLNGKSPARELRDALAGHLPSLRRSAYRLLGNAADADDAVQDALLSACKHLDQFRGESKISTWLSSIVSNSARMRLRHRRRHIDVPLDEQRAGDRQYSASQKLAGPGPNPEEKYRNRELCEQMTRLANQLSPTLRKTFQLRDMDGLSIRETAKALDIPVGTVKAQLTRARKKLRQSMKRPIQPRLA